ncbi:MAG: YidB family protein [Formosimonas sp.]|jgi:uncharacterized protein YidB (DUF937 family)
MGLIDGLLGAALGGNNNNSNNGLQGALLQAVIGMMTNQGGQQSGGLGGLLGGLLGGNNQQSGGGLGGLIGGLLGGGQGANHDAVAGGLGNLTGMLSQLGLGDQVNSWIGTGDNQAVSADQIQNSLGSNGTLAQIAQSAGVSEGEAAGGLADLLPQLINKLTPNGQIDASDIGSVLTSLLGNNKA